MSIRWSFNSILWEPTRSELATISGIIQPEEKARIARFHFIKDAKSSLIGRLLIRKLISIKTGASNDAIQLARDDSNKPILVSPSFNLDDVNSNASSASFSRRSTENLNFNVSHQGSYVVLASEPSVSLLGIDIMNIDKPGRITANLDEYFRLMNRQFTENEWKQIRKGSSDRKRLTNFTRFWCLKESYVKAIGVGIVIDLKTLDFQTEADLIDGKVLSGTKISVDGRPDPRWKFEERFIDSHHIVSVAKLEKSDSSKSSEVKFPDFETVSLDFLLENMAPLKSKDDEWVEAFLAKK